MSSCDSIQRNGFAILPAVFSEDRIDLTLTEISHSSPSRSRAGIRHALRLAPVEQIANEAPLIDLAREVLGLEAFPFRATLFEKSQTANWLVVWHQDTALPLHQRLDIPGWGPWSVKGGIDYAHAPSVALSQILSLRVHLDHSTLENGPLKVLPRTHDLGVLSVDKIQELTKEISAVDCTCPKGGMVAMRPLLVHASSKSQIEMPRRVLHIEYAASESIASPLRLARA
jgi:hypothetical protein